MAADSPEHTLKQLWDKQLVADANERVKNYNAFKQTYQGMMAGMNSGEREIAARSSRKPDTPLITMTAGKPDARLLPYNDLMESARTAWGCSHPAPLEYGASALLKAEIAKYLTRTRGRLVEPTEIFITGGNSGGLRCVMQSYLGPDDTAIVESPLWTPTVNLIAQTGARVLSAGMDAEGISLDEVDQLIKRAAQHGKRIKMIYVQPVNHNPTGTTMSLARAKRLLHLAASHSIIIVSDEPYEMYCYDEQPCFLSYLSGGFGVLTVHTFSKTLGTGLRIGYVHSRPEWIAPLTNLFTYQASVFFEYAVGELMASGRFEQIVADAKAVYARKIKVFCDAIQAHAGRHLAVAPRRSGGFFVWLEFAKLPAFEVYLQMLAWGVEARVGKNMYGPNHAETSHTGVPKECHVGLSFIGPSLEELVEAGRRIGAACDAVEAERSPQVDRLVENLTMTAPIRRVAIIGGTHGNETCGVFVADGLQRHPEIVQRPSVEEVSILIGNPKAVEVVQRFVDDDLNRQFGSAKMAENVNSSGVEAQRARELNHMLGPKGADTAVDFMVDLHTTTSNMGCCMMASSQISLWAAVYAKAWMLADPATNFPIKIMYSGDAIPREKKMGLTSVAKHGVVLECGPTPWGIARFDIVTMMRTAIGHFMDFIHYINVGPASAVLLPDGASWPATVAVNSIVVDAQTGIPARIHPPCDANGRVQAMYHERLQDKDWSELHTGDPMFVHFNGTVECYDGRYGDSVHALFINEAAYNTTNSGLGFMLSQEKEVHLEDCSTSPQARL